MSLPARRGALAAALRGLLPSPAQTALLRFALANSPPNPAVVTNVAAAIGSLGTLPPAPRAALKSLRPLLATAWAQLPAGNGRDTMTALRTGVARESMRMASMRPIVESALRALEESGRPFLLLRGLGLATTVYPEPVSRHCHDLDILVEAGHREAALSALERAGFKPGPPDSSRVQHGFRRVHASGLPVEVHHTLFPERYYLPPVSEWLAGAGTGQVFGRSVAIPAPEHQLVQVLGLAACTAQRHTLRWITDAWLLMTRTAGFDWDRFLEMALASRLAIPLDIQLEWLADTLEAPVPVEVRTRLRTEAEAATSLARDVALFGLRAGALQGEPRLGPATSLRDRLTVLRWVLVPSRAYLAHAHGVEAGATLPFYARRLVRALKGTGPGKVAFTGSPTGSRRRS